jgi:ADP-heptose:LPS heptosyltransferase
LAKPSQDLAFRPRLLVLELWGLGDLALAMPFLRTASQHAEVTLVAKPHAAPILRRFAPDIRLVPFTAPWTAFTGKYRFLEWPWRELSELTQTLRAANFDLGVSARRDPRDLLLLRLAGVRQRIGFGSRGSTVLLTHGLSLPNDSHRQTHWQALATACDWPGEKYGPLETRRASNQRVVVHVGAGQASRRWPRERFEEIANRLRATGWEPILLDDSPAPLDTLLQTLSSASHFIGNDSGPGHLAALLGLPTFTIFGPSLPQLFSTLDPNAQWIEGAACRFRPCWDSCRFVEPHCIRALSTDDVWARVQPWLSRG